MPNSSVALTTVKPGSGERRPAYIHPCVRTRFATNLRTRATLHDYHLHRDKVNAESSQMLIEPERWRQSLARFYG